MRLIILFILLSFGAEASKAQIIRANSFYRPSGTQFLLDAYPNAAAAYSLRKLKSSYSGSAIRIRRDSTGNAETDIGFTANGDLDTTAIKNHCRNNSCMVTTWYNQGDSTAADFTQTTAAAQPRIMTSGVIERQSGKPTIRFDNSGTPDFMDVASSTQKFAFLHFNKTMVGFLARAGVGTNPNDQYTFLSTGTNAAAMRGINILYRDETASGNNDNYQYLIGNNTASVAQIAQNDFFVANKLNLVINNTDPQNNTAASRIIAYYNNSSTLQNNNLTANISLGNASGNFTIGRRGSIQSAYLNGYISEVIIYNSDQSSNRTGIETNINNYYSIYSPTPRWAGATDKILDSFPNAAAAYSIRNLTKTYTGPLIKVRRSSDNAEDDIYGDVNGNLDTAWIKTFAGSGDAFITTWYNQGDSTAVNFTQTTAASQPRIMTSGVIERKAGEPTIRFDVSGTSDFMDVASSTVKFNYLHKTGQAASFGVVQFGTVSNPNNVYSFYNNNNNSIINTGHSIYWDDRASVPRNNVTISIVRISSDNATGNNFYAPDTLALLTNLLDNANATPANRNILYRNGTNEQKNNVTATTPSTANASFNMRIGGGASTNNFPFNGYVSELILYPTDQSSNRTGIETNINNYYGLW